MAEEETGDFNVRMALKGCPLPIMDLNLLLITLLLLLLLLLLLFPVVHLMLVIVICSINLLQMDCPTGNKLL